MSTPQIYVKKPVSIRAMRFDGTAESATAIINWALEHDVTITYSCPGECKSDQHSLKVSTLEGSMTASPGDWIIKGIQDEFYPCKPDIFEDSYSGPTVECLNCGRFRTEQDSDYGPMQAILGTPLGWYSGDDGEFCGDCMTKMINKQ